MSDRPGDPDSAVHLESGLKEHDAHPGQSADAADNPFAPPQTRHPVPQQPNHRLPARWLWLHTVCVVAAAIGCFIEVETIMVTGAVISVTGLLLMQAAQRKGNRPGVLLGLSGPLVAVSCLIVINVLEWSPQDADFPMRMVATACTAASLFLQWQAERVARQHEHDAGRQDHQAS